FADAGHPEYVCVVSLNGTDQAGNVYSGGSVLVDSADTAYFSGVLGTFFAESGGKSKIALMGTVAGDSLTAEGSVAREAFARLSVVRLVLSDLDHPETLATVSVTGTDIGAASVAGKGITNSGDARSKDYKSYIASASCQKTTREKSPFSFR